MGKAARTRSPTPVKRRSRRSTLPRREQKSLAISNAELEHDGAAVGRSLAATAHEILEDLVVTLQLPPGSLWSEEALSERIGIGRTPVREAVKRLEADYLIRILPRHGIMVAEIDHHEQLLSVDLRRELELFISSRAARRALQEERGKLLAIADVIERVSMQGDALAYLRNVLEANRCLAAAARNPFATRSIASLHALSRRFYFRYHTELNNLAKVGQLHSARARAVASGDEQTSRKRAMELVNYVEDYTKRIFLLALG
ncbi:MAG: GntR family transcriptional regulator [Methylobacteriaceae bacterium]|nr:GntR family transcriptional regulator [Methylobacteriaceae bacterium]